MKKSYLVINQIMLLSQNERKAKKISFDPERTIITSKDTDHGKSTLIKCLYYTFGCEVKFNPRWIKTEFISLINFTVRGKTYNILRDKGSIGFFNEIGELIKFFENDYKGLSIYLGSLLNFKMLLKASDSNEYITPPIHHFFSLSYLDQDEGIKSSWSSFINRNSYLKTMKKMNDKMILYHSGKKTNEYYRLISEKEGLRTQIREINSEIKILRRVKIKAEEKVGNYDYINKEVFEKEISEMMKEVNTLNTKQYRIRNRLNDLHNKHTGIVQQIKITNEGLKNIGEDQKLIEQIDEDDIICPVCGVEHKNSFMNRFSLEKDKFEFEQILSELYAEESKIRSIIGDLQQQLNSLNEHYFRIDNIINSKKEKLRLKDYIESRSQQFLSETFFEQIGDFEKEIGDLAIKERAIKENLSALARDEKDRNQEIQRLYMGLMRTYLFNLEAKMEEKQYKKMKITAADKETGSTGFRGLLAHFYAMLNVANKYSSSVFSPIVVDTINQASQSEIKLDKMLELVDKEQPKGSQLIIALGDIAMTAYPLKGKVIELKNQYSLLIEEEYGEISSRMNQYLEQINLARRNALFNV